VAPSFIRLSTSRVILVFNALEGRGDTRTKENI
jgi:hypothetical protein